jgi:hypothetical protein
MIFANESSVAAESAVGVRGAAAMTASAAPAPADGARSVREQLATMPRTNAKLAARARRKVERAAISAGDPGRLARA